MAQLAFSEATPCLSLRLVIGDAGRRQPSCICARVSHDRSAGGPTIGGRRVSNPTTPADPQGRMDARFAQMDARFDKVDQRMDARFDKTDQRMELFEARVD